MSCTHCLISYLHRRLLGVWFAKSLVIVFYSLLTAVAVVTSSIHWCTVAVSAISTHFYMCDLSLSFWRCYFVVHFGDVFHGSFGDGLMLQGHRNVLESELWCFHQISVLASIIPKVEGIWILSRSTENLSYSILPGPVHLEFGIFHPAFQYGSTGTQDFCYCLLAGYVLTGVWIRF